MSNYKDGRTLKKYYCVDCGKELSDYKAKRCNSCNGKSMWQNPKFRERYEGKNNSSYKDGRTLEKRFCIDCGKELSGYTHKKCGSCSSKESMNRPERKKRISGKNCNFYIDGRKNNESYCIDCGKKLVSYIAKRCRNCVAKEIMNRPEIRKLRSKTMKETVKQNWREGIYDGVFQSPTKPEKEIMKILEELKINYIFQFRPKGYGKIYDFYISGMNLLIEFDGVYWHSLEKVKLRDVDKTKYAKDNSYDLLRFNENNLDTFENIIRRKNNAINYV